MNETLAKKLANLPKQPGVYKHLDDEGSVLYVGKAKNLRNRVRSYFHESRPRDGRIAVMVQKIADVEVIVTDTEVEALILENNLIKELQPRYNVNLRDDKSYPYICIKNERFPRVFPTRQLRKDGSKYFGPYTDVKTMNRMLDAIRDIFQLRTCTLDLAKDKIEAGKYDVCLQYHIEN
jgi:excinuclease ABC subunit C